MVVRYSSDNIGPLIQWALEKSGGDPDEVIRVVAPPNNCSYTTARQMAEACAEHLNLTVAEFMSRWRVMREGRNA